MLFILSKKGLFKINICLNYICSMFAAGQVTVRTSYVRGWLARSVSLDHNQQTSKKVQLATQIAQIDPRISRAFSNTTPSRSFQIEGIVILLNRFLNLKQSLFEKRSIFHFPRIDFSKAV